MSLSSSGPTTMLVQSNTEVEILRGWIRPSCGWGGHAGEDLPEPSRAPDGADGMYGGDPCSAETVAGGAAVVNPCEGGLPSVGGKGGDGLLGGAEDGHDGEPTPTPNPSNSPHHPGPRPPRQRGAPAGGAGTSSNTSASGKERTSWPAAASCVLGTSRKRARKHLHVISRP
ncbi:hypothetical protein WME91_11230 [Sorangium sp. So ce269]